MGLWRLRRPPVPVAIFKVDLIAAFLNNPWGGNIVTKARIISALIKQELFSDSHRIDHFFIADRAFGTASNYPISATSVPSNLRFTAHERAMLAERVSSRTAVAAYDVGI
jgi:hypothetical protein